MLTLEALILNSFLRLWLWKSSWVEETGYIHWVSPGSLPHAGIQSPRERKMKGCYAAVTYSGFSCLFRNIMFGSWYRIPPTGSGTQILAVVWESCLLWGFLTRPLESSLVLFFFGASSCSGTFWPDPSCPLLRPGPLQISRPNKMHFRWMLHVGYS